MSSPTAGRLRPPPAAPSNAPAPLSVPTPGFESGRLVVEGPPGARRLRFVATRAERAFRAAYPLLGGCAFGIGAGRLGSELAASLGSLLALGLGVALPLAGLAIVRTGGAVTLDGARGELHRSGGAFHPAGRTRVRLAFADVAVVEWLAHRIGDEASGWTAHQINLVGRDGKRVHVHTHRDAERAERTAAAVAELVGAPLRRVGRHAPQPRSGD